MRDRHGLHPTDTTQRRVFARLWRNLLHAAGGNASAALVGLITLAVTANMLGPVLLGVLAMVEAYGKLIDQIVRIETWQTIIRFGAKPLDAKDRPMFGALLKFGIVTDIVGACASAGIALAMVPLADAILGWGEDAEAMARWFSVSLLLGFASTPIGILRLFDKFGAIAWVTPAIAVARLAVTIMLWMMGGSIWSLLVLAIAATATERLALAFMAWRTLRRHGYGKEVYDASLMETKERFPGIFGFMMASNGVFLIRKSTQELDVLIVGAFAGLAGAGIYQFARKFANATLKIGALIQQVAFPDLARLWARDDIPRFMATVRRVEWMVLAAALALVAIVLSLGERIIDLVGGPGFDDAYIPLVIHSCAVMLFLCGTGWRSGLMAMGRQTDVLYATAAAAAVFYATIFAAVANLGVVGASLSHLLLNALLLPVMALLFASGVRRHSSPVRDPRKVHD